MTEPAEGTSSRQRAPAWLGPVVLWGSVVLGGILLGLYARAPRPPVGAGAMGRTLPRVPMRSPDLPALLYFLGVGSIVWYAVVLALPVMLWTARRVDWERRGRLRGMLLAFAAVVSLASVTTMLDYLIAYRGVDSAPDFVSYLPVALRQDVLPWMAAAGIVVAVEARRRAVHSAVERERLRAQIAEQRLIALTAQLHPHFLFNTLQGISTLIHRDADAADEMLAKLSYLLRDLLRHRDHVLIPLADEIRYTRTYLEIAQLRFADRLRFDIDVSLDLANACVPLFVLQPLVENALSHGIGGRARGGRVTVKAWRDSDRLVLEVADDGAGLNNGTRREGIGLGNTRERLRATYEGQQELTLESGADGGTVARIQIPYRHYYQWTKQ